MEAVRQRLRALLGRKDEGALSAVLGPDGAPRGRPEAALEALWAVAERGADLPRLEEGAFLAGVNALWRIAGELETLPGGGSAARVRALREQVVAWGLDAETAEPMAGKTWACWAYRATGLAVGHARCGREPGRLYLDARTGWLQWDVGPDRILEGQPLGTGGTLTVARVDGRKMRWVAEGPGWRRDVLAQGQRVVVRDRGGDGRWRVADLGELGARTGVLSGKAGAFGVEIKRDLRGEDLEGRTLSVELRT